MNTKLLNTRFALAYVSALRRRLSRDVNAGDVADAYDAGLVHGLHVDMRERSKLIAYLHAMRVVNSVHGEAKS